MIKNLFYLGFFLMSCSSFSQIELPNNSVRFNASDSNVNSPTGFEIPAVKAPSLTNTKNPNAPDNSDLGKKKSR